MLGDHPSPYGTVSNLNPQTKVEIASAPKNDDETKVRASSTYLFLDAVALDEVFRGYLSVHPDPTQNKEGEQLNLFQSPGESPPNSPVLERSN